VLPGGPLGGCTREGAPGGVHPAGCAKGGCTRCTQQGASREGSLEATPCKGGPGRALHSRLQDRAIVNRDEIAISKSEAKNARPESSDLFSQFGLLARSASHSNCARNRDRDVAKRCRFCVFRSSIIRAPRSWWPYGGIGGRIVLLLLFASSTARRSCDQACPGLDRVLVQWRFLWELSEGYLCGH